MALRDRALPLKRADARLLPACVPVLLYLCSGEASEQGAGVWGSLEEWRNSLLRRACVAAQVKKGPLAETSPMLNDISAVPSWSKVGACC